MLKLHSTNFANFKKLWFVSAIQARGLYLTCVHMHNSYVVVCTYVPNYTMSRDHAL